MNIQYLFSDDDQGEDPSIEVSNSQPSQVIYDKESKIKLDYGELEEGKLLSYMLFPKCKSDSKKFPLKMMTNFLHPLKSRFDRVRG